MKTAFLNTLLSDTKDPINFRNYQCAFYQLVVYKKSQGPESLRGPAQNCSVYIQEEDANSKIPEVIRDLVLNSKVNRKQ